MSPAGNKLHGQPAPFRHCCDHLYALLERQRLTGRQAQAVVFSMCGWLVANVDIHSFAWSRHIVRVPSDTTWDLSVANGGSKIDFASVIFFKNESDLLAFRLRWGV